MSSNIDLSWQTCVLDWTDYFVKKLLHKLSIFQLDGVQQHGTIDDDDDEQDKDPPQADGYVQQPVP